MNDLVKTLNDWLGYMFPKEIEEMTRICQTLPAWANVLNIGAGGGVSAATFLTSRPDLHLTTVDIQNESHPDGCLEGERQALIDRGLYDTTRFRQIHANSQELALIWGGEMFDLIFVDGDHSHGGAFCDIWRWQKFVKPGGLMAVHDYKKDLLTYGIGAGRPHPLAWPGVDEVVDALLVPKYQRVAWVDSLVVFQIGSPLTIQINPPVPETLLVPVVLGG